MTVTTGPVDVVVVESAVVAVVVIPVVPVTAGLVVVVVVVVGAVVVVELSAVAVQAAKGRAITSKRIIRRDIAAEGTKTPTLVRHLSDRRPTRLDVPCADGNMLR
ncbi:MAG: hypothetical protein RI637_08665 [Acidimicrobiia bacterium]|nr:hypothetical protein [Acidimicrobiia bacterium]